MVSEMRLPVTIELFRFGDNRLVPESFHDVVKGIVGENVLVQSALQSETLALC